MFTTFVRGCGRRSLETLREMGKMGLFLSMAVRHLFLPPLRIKQVLLNLVMNAFDALSAKNGGLKELVIETRSVKGHVEVSVCDNGCGLPEVPGRDLFGPFVSTKPHGLGMGLSICRTIVEAHGGNLEARNNVDGGATLRVLLPVIPAEELRPATD